ncbi:uncharacterized protein LOC106871855 [Octopus bimaculoides]|uniref:Tantalus-like domain-containing protein n=1 Tax=Octopus bimaculoides TaxID=37653 RepID=A0A0L8HBU4_OCTBM|nr:uncharacterized protein LOC106871855 [Octopus bimaculoides]XP_014774069.1 uncharacterized protein LOC106871855 [Octopus bimaculoides]|eukprot:XP_014774068.1 PREDICTED: uncharacterized protein LOC106871855 [Octopus bimaculoides]
MDGSNPNRRSGTKSRRRSLRTLQLLDSSVNQTTSDALPQNYGSVWINYDTPSPNPKCSRRSISRRSICDSFAQSNNSISCPGKENVYVNGTASLATSSCNTAISNRSETSSINYGDIGNSECYTKVSVPQECLIKVISAMCIEDGSKTSSEKQNLPSDLSTPSNSEDIANSQSHSGKFCEEFVSKNYDINNSYLFPNDLSLDKATDSYSHVPENRQKKFVMKENLMQSQSPTTIEGTSLSLNESLSQENNLTDSLSCSSNNLSSIEANRAEVSDTFFNVSKNNSVCLEDVSDNAIEINYCSKRDITSALSENYSHGITNDSKNQDSLNSPAYSDLSLNSSSLSDLIPVSSDSWHFLTEYPEGNKKDSNTLSDSYLWNVSCESELSNSWCYTSQNSLNKLPDPSIYQCSTPCRAGEALPLHKTPDINKEHALPQSESPLINISGILKGIFVKDVSPVQTLSNSPLYLGQNEQSHRTVSTPSSIDNRENMSAAMQEECILSFKKELPSGNASETNLMAPDSQQISPIGNRGLESLMNNLNLSSNSVSKETSPKLSLETQKKSTAATFSSSEPAIAVSKPKAKKSKSKVLESKSSDSEVALAKRKKLRRRALNIIPLELDIVNEEPINDVNVVHMECFQESTNSLGFKPAEETNQSLSSSKVRQLRTRKSASYSNEPMKDLSVVHMECCSNEMATPLEVNPSEEAKDKSVSVSNVKQRRARKSVDNLKETNSKTKGLKSKTVQNNNKNHSGEKLNNVEMDSSQEDSNATSFRRCSKRKSIEVSLMLNKRQEPALKVVTDEENVNVLKDIYLQKNYKPIKAVQLETIYDCPTKKGINTLFSKKKMSRTLSFETNPVKLKNRRKKALKNWPFMFDVLDAADKRQIMFFEEI